MSKTIKNKYDDMLTVKKLLEAHERAKKGKSEKAKILKFEMDLETNIINIYNELKKNKYKPGKYHEFKIFEPKERIIKSLPYKDRIIHQWYIEEFIKPFFLPRLINDTYACINFRGIHKAIKKLQLYMRKMKVKFNNYYIIKGDISKYFYNIDRNILFNILKRNISDKKLLNLTYAIIFDNDNNVGIPIGNYTSQYFANIYLNELDHYVEYNLKIKYYVRYMDDFILLVEDKEKAKKILNKIDNFINNNLNLKLNNKSNYYPHKKGADFCGYIIFENYIKVRKNCVKKIKKKIKVWNMLYLNNELDYNKFLLSFNSFKAHIKHANSYNLLKKCEDKIIFYN